MDDQAHNSADLKHPAAAPTQRGHDATIITPAPTSPPPPEDHFDPAYPGRHHETDDPWADDTWNMPLPGQQAALDALQWNWGQAYEIGCDDGLWWYRRRDRKGGTETATNPDELRAHIVTDYTIYPVNRAALPPSPAQPAPSSPPARTAPEHA